MESERRVGAGWVESWWNVGGELMESEWRVVEVCRVGEE